MSQLQINENQFPKQEVRYSAPVNELLFGLSNISEEGTIRDILFALGTVVLLLLFFIAKENIIYPPMAIALMFLISGLFLLPALSQPLPLLKWDSQKITFPLLCWSVLGISTKKQWSDLEQVNFINRAQFKSAPNQIQFVFKDNVSFRLKIDAFRKTDLENFIHSIRVFAPHVGFHPELEKLDIGLDTTKSITSKSEEVPSHTSLWMAELNRIAPTVFVPLDTGDTLQDNMIEVVGQVATGGLSAIYLVKSKVYNISILKESVLPDTGEDTAHTKVIEMFKREAKILSTLKHDRIVNVYDYFVENDRHYLLMEFIDGYNLRKVVNSRGKQTEQTVIRWALEMAEILSYLHHMTPPVVHRDFTPDNIILENDASVTLIDFGAANHCLTTVTGTIVGKTSYMSIEQFQGKPDTASDIYSFAKTLQFLLTGVDPEPFSTDSLLEKGCRISRQLDSLLLSCTVPKEERPDIKQVQTELETIKMIVDRHG